MIIGIDMGGTNIDGVLIEQARIIRTVKYPVDGSDYFQSIWRCLSALIDQVDVNLIRRIQLSTTISTNAIVENKVSRVGLILQPGPGLNWQYERLGDAVARVSGSVDHRGKLIRELDWAEIARVKQDFAAKPIDALAVISKFSTRNPEPEKQLADYFAADYPDITLGHTLSGRLNFPRRVETAYLNAAVAATFGRFAADLTKALADKGISAPVYILKADGGTIDLDGARLRPVETILSGPAASFMGLSALLKEQASDQVLLDIGGTTTDIFFLVDGVSLFEPFGIEIDGRKTLVRAVFSYSIGLGGDSYVRFEDDKLVIGPNRLGPAIAFGGSELTPSDALVYLNRMTGDYPDKSRQAIEELARERAMSPDQLARDIVQQMCQTIKQTIDQLLDKLDDSPVYTIKELLQDRRIRPASVSLIGGPAKALAEDLSQCLNLSVRTPENYSVANAIGAALARPTREINLLFDSERAMIAIPELSVYQTANQMYSLDQAKQLALAYLVSPSEGEPAADQTAEIVEAASFNVIQGYRKERIIRVKAQLRPGLTDRLATAPEVKHES